MNFLPLLMMIKGPHRHSLKTPWIEIRLKEKSIIIIVYEKKTQRKR